MTNFDKNGIYLQYPESWILTEELWGDDIPAITFEDENGIYMIDIYHAGVGPELNDYANTHLECFINELPFLSKIIDCPSFTNISECGSPGLAIQFVVKSYFLLKTRYINPVFRIVGAKSVSFISGFKSFATTSGRLLPRALNMLRAEPTQSSIPKKQKRTWMKTSYLEAMLQAGFGKIFKN